MTKSSESEQTRRVNVTVNLLRKKASPQKVLKRLIARYGLSRRQAYRYLRQAQGTPKPLPVPESKTVFTVKLSLSVIRAVRQQARREGATLSHWVEGVLQRSLNLPPGHG